MQSQRTNGNPGTCAIAIWVITKNSKGKVDGKGNTHHDIDSGPVVEDVAEEAVKDESEKEPVEEKEVEKTTEDKKASAGKTSSASKSSAAKKPAPTKAKTSSKK